jgi:tRNA nucleotidyltransferase (CCA-adding enzyme)
MKINLNKNFTNALPVLKKINQSGYEAYFVGGSVRDALLQNDIHDIDITTSATPLEIKNIFKTADHYSGEKHGTELVFLNGHHFEVTTFRVDGKYTDGRHPEKVSFTRNLKEDLSRRDFTINALALNSDGEIIDLFDGVSDLKNKLIKTVGNPNERFGEDALRILRAYRFASQLGFQIENNTLKATKNIADNLKKIAVERKFEEFTKLISGKFANESLNKFKDQNIDLFLPANEQVLNTLVFSNFNNFKIQDSLTNWINFIYNAKIKNLNEYLLSWKMSNEYKKAIKLSIDFLNNPITNHSLFNIGDYLLNALQAVNHPKSNQIIKQFEKLQIKKTNQLAINGNQLIDLGIPKGEQLGIIIQKLIDKVINNEIKNDYESLKREIIK